MSKVVFTVQIHLPKYQHVRLVGSIFELGQWSLFKSVELRCTSQNKNEISCNSTDGSNTATYSTEVHITEVGKFFYRYLICEKVSVYNTELFTLIKVGPLQGRSDKLTDTAYILDGGLLDVNDTAYILDGGLLDVDESTWVDGWLLHQTQVNLTIHNSNGFPIRLFQHCETTNLDYLHIKLSKIGANEETTCCSEAPYGVFTKVIGEYVCFVGEQKDIGVCYDPLKHHSFVSHVLDLNDVLFKMELYCSKKDGSQGDLLGSGFIMPANIKGSRGVVDVSICNGEFLVASVQVEYLVIKPLDDKSLHDVDYLAPDRNWQNVDTTLNMGHRGCGETFSTSLNGLQENTIESFVAAFEQVNSKS